MSELGDTFKTFREAAQKKRAANLQSTLELLDAQRVPYQRLSEHHLRVGEYDFWPSTGLWINRTNKRMKGRGVINLLCKIGKTQSEEADKP